MLTRILLGLMLLAVDMMASGQVQSAADYARAIQKGHAQPGVASQAAEGPQTKLYLNAPFQDVGNSVPKNFYGVDPEKLFVALDTAPALADKSPTETPGGAQTTVAAFDPSGLLPGLRPASEIAVVLTQVSDGDIPSSLIVSYDADNSELALKLLFHKSRLSGKHLPLENLEMATVETVIKTAEEKTYEATNANGTRFTATDTLLEAYGVAIEPGNWLFSSPEASDQPSIELKMPRVKALAVKPMLSVALIGKLAKPWVAAGAYSQDATADSPARIREGLHYFIIQPSEAIVFRRDTGEILKRVRVGDSPLLNLEIYCKAGNGFLAVELDNAKNAEMECSEKLTLRARHSIRIEEAGAGLSDVIFTLNGQPYTPIIQQDHTFSPPYIVITAP